MKTSLLIKRLQELVDRHGDLEFYLEGEYDSFTFVDDRDLVNNVYYCPEDEEFEVKEGIYL